MQYLQVRFYPSDSHWTVSYAMMEVGPGRRFPRTVRAPWKTRTRLPASLPAEVLLAAVQDAVSELVT